MLLCKPNTKQVSLTIRKVGAGKLPAKGAKPMSKITEAEKTAMLEVIKTCDPKVRPILRMTVIVAELFGLAEATKMLQQLDEIKH